MFGSIERGRLSMHEKTLLQAILAAEQENVRGTYALAVTEAAAWLAAQVGPSSNVGLREIVDDVPPYALKAADEALLRAADVAFHQGTLPSYHARTILAGIMLTKVVEVARPQLALRAVHHRQVALDFLEPLFNRGVAYMAEYQRALADTDPRPGPSTTPAPEQNQRTKVVATLSSEGIAFEADPDNTRFCINAVTATVQEVMRRADCDTETQSLDDMWAGAILGFIFAAHLARILEGKFEITISCAMIPLFHRQLGEDLAAFHVSVADDYNAFVNSGKVVHDIGSKFASWLHAPTHEGFNDIVMAHVRLRYAHASGRPAYAHCDL